MATTLKICDCGGKMKAVDSRDSGENMVRRRYKCPDCGARKSTLEYEVKMSSGINAGRSLKKTIVKPYLDVMNDAVRTLNTMKEGNK